jgi:transcriptional regulator with XRE-family HTH domain
MKAECAVRSNLQNRQMKGAEMTPVTPATRPPSREILGGNLVIARARARLSQAALAEAAGVTRQTISDIERGATNATLDVLDKIVDALGISIDRLFIPPFNGVVDDDELLRRRASPREENVDARDLLVAIDEAAARPTKGYSAAGRPRVRR